MKHSPKIKLFAINSLNRSCDSLEGYIWARFDPDLIVQSVSGAEMLCSDPKVYHWLVVEVHFANSLSAGKVVQRGTHWFQLRDDAAWHGRQWLAD